jgi:3-deoxy-D-arabino-heptulosonate 7-phosphate (DAHP) synthase class II
VTSELVDLIKALNPTNTPGKVVLISRFGASKVIEKLSEIIRAVEVSQFFSSMFCSHGVSWARSLSV